MWVERGAIRKDPGGRLNIALVYPNTYRVGMSNLGIHAVYHALNAHPGIVCERFFLDTERSVEAGRRLTDFNIVAFSVSYELDWINALRILKANRIPIKRAERDGIPVIMAGGPAVTMNPEPVAEALDFCFMGDGEPIAEVLFDAFEMADGYDDFLTRLQDSPGIYIPARTRPVKCADGRITTFDGPVPQVSVQNPLSTPARTRIFTPQTTFGDMFLLETARGCYFKCKFCTARGIYDPFRAISLANLLPALDEAEASGLKLGLVTAALNNHPEAEALYDAISERGLKIAPPSLRSGMITDRLLELIVASGVKGITLAPEAGSDRLRRSAGKPITSATIIEDVRRLVEAGVRDIKLYFMVGLPGETDEDIGAIAELCEAIRRIFVDTSRAKKRIGTISVSINTMVPKPHTAFEREPMLDPAIVQQRLKEISRRLKKMGNIRVGFDGPQWAYRQTIVARGGRDLLDLLIPIATEGDGAWQGTLHKHKDLCDRIVLKTQTDERLPWHFAGSRGG